MSQDMPSPADADLGYGDVDADLLAGLWEEAPFARLPWDAPSELRDVLEDIDNPKRVYAVHKASRRNNFQSLLQKYVIQLRDGCDSSQCSTPTCLTCRKRVAGRSPIRRYNTTSARALAVYLASQDNPESGLCPALRPPNSTPDAVKSLIFTPKYAPKDRDDASTRAFRTTDGHVRGTMLRDKPTSARVKLIQTNSRRNAKDIPQGIKREAGREDTERWPTGHLASPNYDLTEKPVSKDYRSFAANMFGTVAFKMLEWLTPAGIEDISQRARQYQDDFLSIEPVVPQKSLGNPGGNHPMSPLSRSWSYKSGSTTGQDTEAINTPSTTSNEPTQPNTSLASDEREVPLQQKASQSTRPGPVRRNSNTRVRASSSSKPRRNVSIDAITPELGLERGIAAEEVKPALISPRLASIGPEKTPRTLKSATSTISRPISQLSTSGFLSSVALEKMPPQKPAGMRPKFGYGQLDGMLQSESESSRADPTPSTTSDQSQSDLSLSILEQTPPSAEHRLLPQTLTKLDAEIVDFLCDVAQEDQTTELHQLEPPSIARFHLKSSCRGNSMRRRKRRARQTSLRNIKLEWKLFIEQSLFYILSDTESAILSFTEGGKLYDSQTLWYCMLRMTRVMPSLVFHSLWLAAGRLFAPPQPLQDLRSPTARLFPKQDKALSNEEAGYLLSICLHALIAAAPLVSDAGQLYDMSRIRSHGLCLAESGAVARQPPSLCLQYDDAFSNDLAMRLARRLFAAITCRRYFDGMADLERSPEDDSLDNPDVLAPLFSQLDFLNMDAIYVLDFSFADRALHETRVPTLLLDWARAVMFHDWDGQPEVPGDGPFGGAIALIDAMYKKRHALLLGDVHFRSEYFAERLDPVTMPVAWLSFNSTRRKMHLLDFPYIFNPATLVTYFRSINFSRMSRSFEASSSLQSRMGAIIAPGSLIIDPHHKAVLQDLLRTASSKYLILDIGRENVLRDSFDQLWRREERELMRPLKVHLGEDSGEEGFDSGGVQQEFFRLAIAEALNPDYGAFTIDERTRMTWFQPGSLEPEWKFELIGLLVSLAVYNGLTLPITFPRALYMKLLGEPITELHHIADGWPDLASGLTALLEWDEKDGLVEDVFARTYEFSISAFDAMVSREMTVDDPEWPQFPTSAWGWAAHPPPQDENPTDAPMVTNENRNAYVSDYIRYLTDVSVRPQFEAFARGFRTCLHPKSLKLLNPSLLQSVVEGVQEIDVAELRRYARYVGWDASHRTIRDFWSLVKRYDNRMRRRLLEFVTASDRVPVGGVKNMQFVIQRNGEQEGERGHLPTAYTCYGTLLLPEYKDKDVLRDRLAMALENAQGFGFA